MRHLTDRHWRTLGKKLYLTAILTLLMAVVVISVLVTPQSRHLAEREIATLERQLIAAKRAELKNSLSLARTAFINIYGRAAPDDTKATLTVTQILSSMIYGTDGYSFVYDYDDTPLVSPRHTRLIGENWQGMTDANGTGITDTLFTLARAGSGYQTYEWPKPSIGEPAAMVAYVVGLQDWRWVAGTGVFIDDLLATVATARAQIDTRVQRSFLDIGGLPLLALLLVCTSGLFITIRERRLADAKLKQLTQRVFGAQEKERGRGARERHDGISQMLVGARHALDVARRRLDSGSDRAADVLEKGATHLAGAIQEVRRISRDLRPGTLDDLGLGPALKALTEDFGKRCGLTTQFDSAVFRNRLDDDAKIALNRVAQEALTNIERHSRVTHASIHVRGHKDGATLRISDNGHGLDHARPDQNTPPTARPGPGLRNMQERIKHLDGTLRILSSASATVIEATVPLTHMLPPQTGSSTTKASA
jgi:two-component system NarL family sensor kinase